MSIRIGVSSCLLGQQVRFDGGHKRDSFLLDTLGPHVEWVAVCPEVEAGLGTPRESMRLLDKAGNVRLITGKTNIDHTDTMMRYARRRVAALAKQDLSGFVLKKSSPSCGMERVKIYPARGGVPARKGRGLFAEALLEELPLLPVEEEGRLCDARLRENFIERVFAYRRLRSLFGQRWSVGNLVAFHTSFKLQLLAHSPAAYQLLGRLVATAKTLARIELRSRYEDEFMRAMKIPATRPRQTNVLQHMVGHFKKDLDADSREELAGVIHDYRHGLVPLIVPLTLVRHYVRHFDVAYLKGQSYLEPHPKELMLRNHV